MPRASVTLRSRVDSIPGLYEHIRAGWQRELVRGGPRIYLCETMTERQRKAFDNKSPHIQQARRIVAAMTDGVTVTIGSRQLGREFRQHKRRIGWLADPFSPCVIEVTADDVVSPADGSPDTLSV